MIPIILLAAGGVVALDLAKRYLPPGMLQSLRGHTANGAPLQIVIPVDGNTTNGKSQIPSATGQPTTLRINIPGWPWWGQKNTNPSQPVIITPGGASNFHVSTNQDVQRALNTLGYAQPPLALDGDIGPLSQAAIRRFEQSKNLQIDGQVSSALKLALEIALVSMAAPTNLQGSVQNVKAPPVDLSTTMEVQHALNLLGASPQLVEDGKLGPKTIAAIKAFQIMYGLVVDGVAGPETKTAMAMAMGKLNAGCDLDIRHGNLRIQHNDNVNCEVQGPKTGIMGCLE